MTKSLITDAQLTAALGFSPQEGRAQLQSPPGTTHQLATDIHRQGDRLSITTHECGLDEQVRVEMLCLSLQRRDAGWEIQQQAHSGLDVHPDADLALQSLANNLSATPLNPHRNSPRP